MVRMRLSQNEIKKRLIRLRNLEKLYDGQKERIKSLSEKNKILEARIVVLEKENKDLRMMVEDFKLQMEELQIMVFGKKKEKTEIDDDDIIPPKEKIVRTIESYKRPIPKDEEVTETEFHPLRECEKCHTKTTKKKVAVFYEEDIRAISLPSI